MTSIIFGDFNKSFWKSGRYKKAFKNSMREQKMYISVQPYAAPELSMVFSMKGFTKAITKLAEACAK